MWWPITVLSGQFGTIQRFNPPQADLSGQITLHPFKRRFSVKPIHLLAMAASLILAAAESSRADMPGLRALLPAQATLGGWPIERLRPLSLTRGDLVVGGVNAGRGVLLRVPLARPTAAATVLVAPGALRTLVGGVPQPWGRDLYVTDPVADAAGSVAFGVWDGYQSRFERWWWDGGSGLLRPIGKFWNHLAGDPLKTLLESPLSLNSGREIAFTDLVADKAWALAAGVFVRAPDGAERAVVTPGQTLEGVAVRQAVSPSISDKGAIALLASLGASVLPEPFLAAPAGLSFTINRIPLDVAGQAYFVPTRIALSRDGKSVLLKGINDPDPNSIETALWIGSPAGLRPLLVRGQALPGGGTFKSLQVVSAVTPWNAEGRFAFLADLAGGGQGLYVCDEQGQISPVLISGMDTAFGKVRTVGGLGLALGDAGQIAVGLSFVGGAAAEGIFLITPSGQ
jgi:hypothetical protein